MAVEGRSDTSRAAGRIRFGMVGGGEGAFIGAVHRLAARMDDQFQLVAGALASTSEKAKASGAALGLPADRTYHSYDAMAAAEAGRPDGIEAVVIVTPNHLHVPVAMAFLQRGIHVICEKPLASTLDDAKALARTVHDSGRLFILTHNYTGYPMVRQARAMVAAGALGAIRVVQTEYPQDWLTTRVEATGHKQADWRTDPARSGAGGCIGDIGTHAMNLANFVTGLTLDSVAADLTTFVAGRRLDDNVHVMLRFQGGARGMLWASQVAPGNENALKLRVYGETGGLHWEQEQPNHLWFTPLGEPKRLLTRAGAGTGAEAARVTRVPPGHPEGYLEGFANIYQEAARAIRAVRDRKPIPADVVFPTVDDGVAGMAFINACVRSSVAGGGWTSL